MSFNETAIAVEPSQLRTRAVYQHKDGGLYSIVQVESRRVVSSAYPMGEARELTFVVYRVYDQPTDSMWYVREANHFCESFRFLFGPLIKCVYCGFSREFPCTRDDPNCPNRQV